MRIAMTSQDASKRKICGNLENSGVCLILRYIQRSQNPGGTVRRSLNRADSEKELRASLLLTSLSLSDSSSTRIFKRTHTHQYRSIWTMANQRGGPPFTISDWFRPRYETNVSVVKQQRDFLSRGDFFFFLEWLDAPVRPKFFFSRTLEKLGRTCD